MASKDSGYVCIWWLLIMQELFRVSVFYEVEIDHAWPKNLEKVFSNLSKYTITL